jgi:cytochrome b561
VSKANDILAQIFIIVFFVVMGGIPLTVWVLGTINFVRATTRRGTIVLQVLVSMAAWVILTYALVMIFVVVIFSMPYPLSRANEFKSTAFFIAGCFVYMAVGALLIHWTRRQAALPVAAPLS